MIFPRAIVFINSPQCHSAHLWIYRNEKTFTKCIYFYHCNVPLTLPDRIKKFHSRVFICGYFSVRLHLIKFCRFLSVSVSSGRDYADKFHFIKKKILCLCHKYFFWPARVLHKIFMALNWALAIFLILGLSCLWSLGFIAW